MENVGRTKLFYWQGVTETTFFGLLGGHHQVHKFDSTRQ